MRDQGRGRSLRNEGELTVVAIDTPALTCTLELQEMGTRLERLRRLAETSLQSHQLEGNVLRPTYHLGAAREVKSVVDLERDCCRFLDFDVQERASSVDVTITAPEGVGSAAKWLFARFMPTSAAKAPERGCCASCG